MEINRLLADGLLVVIIALAVVAVLKGIKSHDFYIRALPYAIMSGLTSLLIGKMMSLIYQPATPRPFIDQGVAPGAAFINNPGFPSDHILLATVVILAIYFTTSYKKLSLVLIVLAIIMGAARVVALVHTPIDIFGGIVAGLLGATWYLSMRKQT